jgi:hypothetical protein
MLATVGVLLSLSTVQAVTCANGVYRAGCAGPNGAAVVACARVLLTRCSESPAGPSLHRLR